MKNEVFVQEEVSGDLKKRLVKQQYTPYSKVDMNRKIVHQIVRDKLKTIINQILQDYGIEAEIETLGDDYFRDLVKSFVPFFELCSLCRSDKHCPVQSIVIESNKKLYSKLQQTQPPIESAPTFTMTKCGMFDLIDVNRLMTGYKGSRESSLQGNSNA